MNHFDQDSASEIKVIKKLITEAYLEMMLIREQGHREVRKAFQQNPGPKLIKMCDEKAKEVIISTSNTETSNNMRHRGEQVIMKGGQISSFPVKELIREVDAKEEESN